MKVTLPFDNINVDSFKRELFFLIYFVSKNGITPRVTEVSRFLDCVACGGHGSDQSPGNKDGETVKKTTC